MAGELGKASLDLEANLAEFRRNIAEGKKASGGMRDSLEAVAAISKIAEEALQRVKMKPGQGAESAAATETIERSLGRVGRTALNAADHLQRVKITAEQAARSDLAGDVIDRKLRNITGNANEARRALESVRIFGGVPGRSGVGVGPFGSGFGRVGLLGTAIAAGTLTAPSAGPAAAGLLAAIPALAFTGAGALGTLALAFNGVGKAIGGDLKAFKELEPAQQKFVLTIRSLDGWIDKLKQTAGKSLFPGLTEGLRSALSPGTVGAITKAVGEFGRAIGQSGAQWGRYFGSASFQQLLGPLMRAGAQNIRTLSSTLLHLFDAFAVLGRAAIPFTNWLLTAANRGSQLASSWLRAKEASGGLGRAMNEARTSLRLVGGALTALGRAIGALGVALYPVSKLAVKSLTDGLNALARTIRRNQAMIREIVGGALAALVSTVRTLTPIIGRLARGLNAVAHAMGGWKVAFQLILAGALASKFTALGRSVLGVGAAATTASAEVAGLRGRLAALSAFKVIGITILVTEILQHKKDIAGVANKIPGFKSLSEYEYKHNPVAKFLDDLMGVSPNDLKKPPAKLPKPLGGDDFRTADLTSPKKVTDTGSTDTDSPFGEPPPFDKNVPKPKKPRKPKAPPVIPALASHAEALASANASRASALHNVGRTARRYLENELADLNVAVKALKEKYATATGKARTELFAAIVRDQNKSRRVNALLHKTIVDDRAAELQLAVDQAKDAVASATKGTDAYETAIKAEEKALRAQISYLDKRAKNSKLSLAARSKALRQETSDKKQLAALLKPDAAAKAGADRDFFLGDVQRIIAAYAPNFGAPISTGKLETHGYDTVTELRQIKAHLRDIKRDSSFPGSAYAGASVEAVIA